VSQYEASLVIGVVFSTSASTGIIGTVNESPGQPVLHGSFTVERDLDAAAPRVFAAYADQAVRKRWFRMPGGPEGAHELDFSVGGHEMATGTFAGSGVPEHLHYSSTFCDIVNNKRIVYTYAFTLDNIRRWVSLVTLELTPNDNGTRLTHTEQYSYLSYTADGQQDVAHLKGSTRLQLNALAAALGSQA
jgi:uncharacterized protein YndB with AHSA1/START domain